MRIDPTKVLVIGNSSRADDRAMAEWYAVARGLGADAANFHFLSADFGAGSGLANWRVGYPVTASLRPGQPANQARYVGQDFLTALRNMLQDGEIQALLVTPGVPQLDNYNPTSAATFSVVNGEQWITDENFSYGVAGTFGQPIEARMCQANKPVTYKNCANFLTYQRRGVGSAAEGYLSKYQAVDWGWVDYHRDTPYSQIKAMYPSAYESQTINNIVGWGRIGWPGCTLANIQRVVADALWAESQDNSGKQHIIGGALYLGTEPPSAQYLSWKCFSDAGWSDLYHFNNATELAENPGYTANNTLNFSDYAAGAAPVNAFATMLESSTGNTGALFQPGGAIYNATSFPRGAWGFWWTSYAANFAKMLLSKPGTGGVAAFTSVNEPYANGLIRVDHAAASLLNGASMLEAIVDGAPFNTTVWGDPLYRPYKAKRASMPSVTLNSL